MTGAGVDPRRRVPRTDVVLADPLLAEPVRRLGPGLVKQHVLAAQAHVRGGQLEPDAVVGTVLAALPPTAAGSVTPVINATGVLLHTNIGRAALSEAAVEALRVAAGTCDVELDLATGSRARRGRGALDALASAVPSAGAVHLVNNGAAALALVATALAGPGSSGAGAGSHSGAGPSGAGGEIVIARGELVEIGDGFRIPELLVATGARLREVGTTNRVRLEDYAQALGPDTAFVLKVHPSNFRISGFTSSVTVRDLATLGPPVVVDIGSGLLAPEPLLPDEPDAATALSEGATLVTASGDKLLGGPQAGLLLGSPGAGSELVERLRRHPLARALRVDKLTLAAMEATLIGPRTPTHRGLHATLPELTRRTEALAARLAGLGLDARAVASESEVGGGGAPGLTLPSAAVSLPERFALALRSGTPAVLGRLRDGRCLLDLRAVPAEADASLLDAVRAAAG